MVSPKLAAAAAQKALEILSEDDPIVVRDALAAKAAATAATAAATAATAAAAAPGSAAAAATLAVASPAAAVLSLPTGAKELSTPLSLNRVRIAAAAALSAAAAKARLLAEVEEREMVRLVAELVELQVGGKEEQSRRNCRSETDYLEVCILRWVAPGLWHWVEHSTPPFRELF